MTEETLDRLAGGSGLLPWEADGLTFGELRSRLEGLRERERQQMQCQAVIAYQQVGLLAEVFGGGKIREVYEIFPFWEEEEIRELKVEKYRQIMERYACAGKGGDGHGGKGTE